MMIRSMTGFAQVERSAELGRLSWELRSVNHRYLEIQFRLPEEFRSLENELRSRANAALGRGKVEANLKLTRSAPSQGQLAVDVARLRAVLGALAQITAESRASTHLDALGLLAFPGVLNSPPVDTAPTLIAAAQLFSEGLDELNLAKAREGERLGAYVLAHASAIGSLTRQVRERAPIVRDAWISRLRSKMHELSVEIEPARLAQEVALAAQRLDVDEEMARLEGHVVEIETTLGRSDAVGRRLDFLMQELNREANTLSSKSQDSEMTRLAVEMKVLIEQMREQIQNIE